MTGPRVVTKRQWSDASSNTAGTQVVSRRAVATLDEARACADREAERTDAHWYQREDITESGGTVGPLPDGTVIEVKPTTWEDLAEDLAWVIGPRRHALMREAEQGNPGRLLAVWNGQEEARR